jgi:hypothetical protein
LCSFLGDDAELATSDLDSHALKGTKRREKGTKRRENPPNCLYCPYEGQKQWHLDRHTKTQRMAFIPDFGDPSIQLTWIDLERRSCLTCNTNLETIEEVIDHLCQGKRPDREMVERRRKQANRIHPRSSDLQKNSRPDDESVIAGPQQVDAQSETAIEEAASTESSNLSLWDQAMANFQDNCVQMTHIYNDANFSFRSYGKQL